MLFFSCSLAEEWIIDQRAMGKGVLAKCSHHQNLLSKPIGCILTSNLTSLVTIQNKMDVNVKNSRNELTAIFSHTWFNLYPCVMLLKSCHENTLYFEICTIMMNMNNINNFQTSCLHMHTIPYLTQFHHQLTGVDE